MKRFHYVLLSFFMCSIYAQDVPLSESDSVSSTQATYDGNALLLSGHVVLDHGLGKMTAEEASLQKQEVGKDFPFSVIHLRKDVHLALKSTAELLCEAAYLDFNTLKGELTAKENDKVVYLDHFQRKNESVPFKLTGTSVELLFLKQTSDDKKNAYDIETLLMKDTVTIEYASAFHLQGDHALYRKLNAQNPHKEFQGIITTYAKDESSKCHLTHGQDRIDADTIDLNMVQSKLSFLHPAGVLYSTLVPNLQQKPLHFSADHLIWDHLTGTLSLNGHVQAEEESLGHLTALESVQLIHSVIKGNRGLKEIIAQGPATLTYRNPACEPHKLISYGKMDLNREKLIATIDSPEIEGQVPRDKQIYYEEEEIGVFADQAALEYSETEGLLQPISIHLKGHIRLFSHDPKQPPRCGISDRVNYSLTTRTLILSANPGNKVLFWDEGQGLRMSASEVHITQDPETSQRSIKGVGKVQLSLTAEEQQQLKQLFPHYKVTYE